jgi:hypothetical protein
MEKHALMPHLEATQISEVTRSDPHKQLVTIHSQGPHAKVHPHAPWRSTACHYPNDPFLSTSQPLPMPRQAGDPCLTSCLGYLDQPNRPVPRQGQTPVCELEKKRETRLSVTKGAKEKRARVDLSLPSRIEPDLPPSLASLPPRWSTHILAPRANPQVKKTRLQA